MNRIRMHEGELWPRVRLATRAVTQSLLLSQRVPGCLHYWPPLSKPKRGGGGESQPSSVQPLHSRNGKPLEGRPGGSSQGAGGGAPPSARHSIPAGASLPSGTGDRYLVQMRVAGDIVSSLLQGHRAPWARRGVAAAGWCGERPARDGAAGPAARERQPRAGAQRGAHAPCADLVPGRNQGQRRLPAGQALRVPQGAEPEWRHVLGARAGVPTG